MKIIGNGEPVRSKLSVQNEFVFKGARRREAGIFIADEKVMKRKEKRRFAMAR